MNTNPINLAIRFTLEIIMLIILAYWGWHMGEGWLSYVAAIGCPVFAAALWGIFRIENDPKPAPVLTPGPVRLLLEFVLFGWAVWALYQLGKAGLGEIMALMVILHYVVSYDRTWTMLRNKPYKGFVE